MRNLAQKPSTLTAEHVPNIVFRSNRSMRSVDRAEGQSQRSPALTGNLLFALDDHGVRDRVVPMIAFEYGF